MESFVLLFAQRRVRSRPSVAISELVYGANDGNDPPHPLPAMSSAMSRAFLHKRKNCKIEQKCPLSRPPH